MTVSYQRICGNAKHKITHHHLRLEQKNNGFVDFTVYTHTQIHTHNLLLLGAATLL